MGISLIGSALDSTPPQAGLRKILERQPLIDPNREERLWKDDSARRRMTHGALRAKPVVPPLKYPPTPLGAKALGAQLPRLGGLSACGEIRRSNGFQPTAVKARFTHSSTGKARGLLRRRIRISIKPLSKVLGSPVCGGFEPSGFGTCFSEKV